MAEQVKTSEELRKGFDDAVESLRKSLEALGKSKADKAKKIDEEEKKLEDEESDIFESDDEGTDKQEKGKAKPKPTMNKSVADYVADGEDDAQMALDMEPFLKSLVDGVDGQFEVLKKGISGKLTEMSKSIESLNDIVTSMANATIANSDLQKSIQAEVTKIGDTAQKTSSIKGSSTGRFALEKSEGAHEYSRGEILEKAIKLRQNGKVDNLFVTKIEGRLNKGIDLDAKDIDLIKSIQ
jgi:hypothetical protein